MSFLIRALAQPQIVTYRNYCSLRLNLNTGSGAQWWSHHWWFPIFLLSLSISNSFFSFYFLFVFFCIIYGFGDWVSLKTGIWVSGCGNLEALVAFSFGGYGFGDLVVAFKYGGCGLCLKFPVDLVSVVLERENDGEAEREERDWCWFIIFYWIIYIIVMSCIEK